MSRKMSLRREIRLKREPVTGRARRERKREKVIVDIILRHLLRYLRSYLNYEESLRI